MMRRAILSNPYRRQLCRNNPRIIAPHSFLLRSSLSEAAAIRLLDDDDEQDVYSYENIKPPIVKDVPLEHKTLLASDKLLLPDYVACTLAHPSDKPEYVPPAYTADQDDLLQDLKSRPVERGNWNPAAPLKWAQTFGRRSAESAARLATLVKLGPGDEGYFDVSDMKIPGLPSSARRRGAYRSAKAFDAPDGTFHACDTEVMDIDLKTVGPVGNGYVTCVSVYSGPDFDYGLGDGPGSTLWIDNLDDSAGLLQEFKDWFQDSKQLKVWHNYGFDRHVMWNEGIDCRGFGGDTMHMARLQDTSRSKYGLSTGYSLEALTESLLERRKKPMKELFGIKRTRKDGTEGLVADIPPIEVMQRDPKHRQSWIIYSAYDAEGTWLLREELQKLLEKMTWVGDKNMYDYYQMYMRAFGSINRYGTSWHSR
ncbi:DNA polymerase A domain [Fragilaria crotonensis]|nr:DNA polymerase A domain [Fragilaria crotonensis]